MNTYAICCRYVLKLRLDAETKSLKTIYGCKNLKEDEDIVKRGNCCHYGEKSRRILKNIVYNVNKLAVLCYNGFIIIVKGVKL